MYYRQVMSASVHFASVGPYLGRTLKSISLSSPIFKVLWAWYIDAVNCPKSFEDRVLQHRMSFTWKREQRMHEVFVPKRVEKTNLRHSWIKGTRPMHVGAQEQAAFVCCLACCPPSAPAWQPRCTPRLQNWAALLHPLVHIFFHGSIFWPDFGSQEFVSLFFYSILSQGFCFVINPATFICQSSPQVGWVVPCSYCVLSM